MASPSTIDLGTASIGSLYVCHDFAILSTINVFLDRTLPGFCHNQGGWHGYLTDSSAANSRGIAV